MLKKTVKSLQVMGVTDVKEALLDFKDAHKRTALHFAAAKGRRQVITYILEQALTVLKLWTKKERPRRCMQLKRTSSRP